MRLGRIAALAGCGAALVWVTGCGQKTAPTARVGPPVRGWVRFETLVRAHPLQKDALRLAEAEQNLLQFARRTGAQVAATTASGGDYVLPPLTGLPQGAGAVQAASRARLARTGEARQLLDETAQASLARFKDERARRLQGILEQRRAELRAIDAVRLAEEIRLARQRLDDEVRGGIAAKTDEVVRIQAHLAALDAQLDPKNGVFPPLLERSGLEAEIRKLRADPKAIGISPRARLTLLQADLQAQLAQVTAELAQIKARGADRAIAAAKAISAQRNQEIENQLEALADGTETQFLVREQLALAKRAQTDEAALVARREARLTGGGASDGAVSLAAIFGRGAGAGSAGVNRAAERLARQRVRLQNFIRADVRDALRDAAQTHQVDLVVAENDADGKGATQAGRQDMTADFARWIQPAEGAAPGKAAIAQSVTDTPRDRTDTPRDRKETAGTQ